MQGRRLGTTPPWVTLRRALPLMVLLGSAAARSAGRSCRSISTRPACRPPPTPTICDHPTRRCGESRPSCPRSGAGGPRTGDRLRLFRPRSLRAGPDSRRGHRPRPRGGAERLRGRRGQAPPAAAPRRAGHGAGGRVAAAHRPRDDPRLPDRAGAGGGPGRAVAGRRHGRVGRLQRPRAPPPRQPEPPSRGRRGRRARLRRPCRRGDSTSTRWARRAASPCGTCARGRSRPISSPSS